MKANLNTTKIWFFEEKKTDQLLFRLIRKTRELKINKTRNGKQDVIIDNLLLFSHSVLTDSSQPQRLQHARLPSPSPSHGVYLKSCPLNWWYHPTISSSVIPFSSCLKSFPASGSFFKWVSSSYQEAKVLEFQLQHQSFQWILRTDFL